MRGGRASTGTFGAVGYTLAADGTRLAYGLSGPEDGEPLVMIQGLGADRRGWTRQKRAFSSKYRVLMPDNRGVGLSDQPPGPYDLAEMADDVIACMDHAGIESAHIMGASMGGIISQVIGVLHPERTRSLTLACTACSNKPWRVELLEGWAEDAELDGMRQFAAKKSKWLVGPRSVRRFWPVLGLFGGLAINVGAQSFVAQLRAILDADEDLRFELANIDVPTLVIVGSQDILTPLGDSEELAGRIPGSRLAVVRGGAHGFMFENAGTFNDTVLDFLEWVSASTHGRTGRPKLQVVA
jgi:3-oxoadipate enol-lactonase